MDCKAFQGCADGDSWHITPGRTTLNTTDLPGVVEFRPTASHGIWRRLPSPSWIAVASHPMPRNHQEARVGDEVEQVIKPTIRAVGRPLLQLRLHPQYSKLGLIEAGPHNVGVHRRPPAMAIATDTSLHHALRLSLT